MERNSPHECNCGCDPLKQILLWFLRLLLQKWDLSSDDLSRLTCFYKTSMIRDLARPTSGVSLECVLTQEIMLHFVEWISNVFLKKTSHKGRNIVCKEDFPRLVENFQSKVTTGATTLIPYVTSATYENPLGYIRLSLNFREVKGPVIKYVVRRGWAKNLSDDKYCHDRRYQVQIVMTCRAITDDEHYFAWEDYRKLVVAQGISKLMSIMGHQVDERHYVTITKSDRTDGNDYNSSLLILKKDITKGENANKGATCSSTLLSNPEVVLKTHVGTITSDSMSLYGLLNERLASISESMRSEASLSACQTSAQNLAKATLHYDILKRLIDAPVHLQRIEGSRERHHALVIMYNYARVLSILKRFNEQVEKLEYPGLPELSEIDFSGICEKEEEIQLLQLLLEWPRILDGSVNFISFEANLHLIPRFLLTLARVFNKFYFEIAVLVPANAPHNFPMMMARVYLVKAICNIFQDCFDIMQLAHTGI